VVPQQHDRRDDHPERGAGDHDGPVRDGSLHRPRVVELPRQHLHAARSQLPDARVRAGHPRVPGLALRPGERQGARIPDLVAVRRRPHDLAGVRAEGERRPRSRTPWGRRSGATRSTPAGSRPSTSSSTGSRPAAAPVSTSPTSCCPTNRGSCSPTRSHTTARTTA
jgi:hypothetical protein